MADGLLAGKVILVTGGADGIGRECALGYAREGAHVVIADIHPDKATQTASELAQAGLAIRCDAADPGSVQRAVEASIGQFARLDAVHNNAGLSSPSKPLHETTEDEWDRLLEVNLKSVFLTTRFAFGALAARKDVS